jgi:hypothetical protein
LQPNREPSNGFPYDTRWDLAFAAPKAIVNDVYERRFPGLGRACDDIHTPWFEIQRSLVSVVAVKDNVQNLHTHG